MFYAAVDCPGFVQHYVVHVMVTVAAGETSEYGLAVWLRGHMAATNEEPDLRARQSCLHPSRSAC